jgi:ferrous iron transport protein A
MDKSNGNKKSVHFIDNRTSLAQMLAGQSGKIVGISGGYGLARKLDALGIREGKKIKKISEQWMRGPVLLQYGNTQIALGFGMATRVSVEISGDG